MGAAIRVDGNDILAVRDSIKVARLYTLNKLKPIMIELMTYRGSHHSTSDDSTRYRNPLEIIYWNKIDNPILRTRKLLTNMKVLTEKKIIETARSSVIDCYRFAEKKQKPSIKWMFEHVFHDKPWHLKEQESYLFNHLSKYDREYYLQIHDEN